MRCSKLAARRGGYSNGCGGTVTTRSSCVVANNGEEYWVYGPFPSEIVAAKFAERLEAMNPGIEYVSADYFPPEDATEELSHE
jgi:hypothetical protein